jgi:hypothetical protein
MAGDITLRLGLVFSRRHEGGVVVAAQEAALFLGDEVLRGASLAARKAHGGVRVHQALVRLGAKVAHVGKVGLQLLHALLVVGGLGVELVVSLDLCSKPPVVKLKGFTDHGVEAARPTRYKLDEPSGEGVHNSFSSDVGLCDQIGEVGLIIVSPEGARELSGPGDALDIAHDAAIALVVIDAKVGGTTVVLLIPHRAFTALISSLLELRDTFTEEGEDLLVGDVVSGAFIQDFLGVLVDGVGAIVSAVAMGHSGLQGGVSDLLHDIRVDFLTICGEGSEEGSGGVELSFADKVFQVTGRRHLQRRGNGECW